MVVEKGVNVGTWLPRHSRAGTRHSRAGTRGFITQSNAVFLKYSFCFFSEGGGVGVFDSLDMVSGYLEAGKIHWKKMLVESWQVLY